MCTKAQVDKIREILEEECYEYEIIEKYNDWRFRQNKINKWSDLEDGRIGNIFDDHDAYDFLEYGDMRFAFDVYRGCKYNDFDRAYFVVDYEEMGWELLTEEQAMEFCLQNIANVYDGFLDYLKEI